MRLIIRLKPVLPLCGNTYHRKKRFKPDELFEKPNNSHSKIKLTIEVSPTQFLDTNLHLKNGM